MNDKVLFLTPSNPFGIGGGSFATHAYLRAFSDIFEGHVDIVMADEWQKPWDNRVKVEKRYDAHPLTFFQYCLSLFTKEIQRFSRVAKRIIQKAPDDYALVVCNGSSIGGKIWRTTKRFGIRLITIHHNYEPEYFADNTKGLHRALYLPIVSKLERLAYLNSDYNLFLTKQDEAKFTEQYGKNHRINKVIGVFEYDDYKEPSIKEQTQGKVSFIITGSLCTIQGVDGIKYFFEQLYQYLPQDSLVIISGRKPTEEVKMLCKSHENVQLVPDPVNMSDVISSGDIYLCPTRSGGGLKLRIMDGLKLGKPVISHVCSVRGYDMFLDTPYLKSFNSGGEFKTAVEEMLLTFKSFSKEEIIGVYKKSFSYHEGLQRIRMVLNHKNS